MRKKISWWRLGGAAAITVAAVAGVVTILAQTGQPTAPPNQVWVALTSTGPAASAQVTIDGRTIGGGDIAAGDSEHRNYLVPSGTTIKVALTALDDGGEVTELTRTMCAIGDSSKGELYVTKNGYGKGTITCTWTRP